jgi:hypothetical protein
MGLSTGLNAFLTAIEAETQGRKIKYIAVEQLPITSSEATSLNYPDVLGHADLFSRYAAVNGMNQWLSMNFLRWKRETLIF